MAHSSYHLPRTAFLSPKLISLSWDNILSSFHLLSNTEFHTALQINSKLYVSWYLLHASCYTDFIELTCTLLVPTAVGKPGVLNFKFQTWDFLWCTKWDKNNEVNKHSKCVCVYFFFNKNGGTCSWVWEAACSLLIQSNKMNCFILEDLICLKRLLEQSQLKVQTSVRR